MVTAFIAPYKKDRDVAREVHVKDGLEFIEVCSGHSWMVI